MRASHRFDPLIWGVSMLVFAVGVIAGTIIGGKYRYSWALMEVPWGENSPPSDPEEAWLWISFANDALAYGVSAKDIKAIYQQSKTSQNIPEMNDVPWPSFRSRKPTDDHKPPSRIIDEYHPPARPGASPH